MHSCPHCTRRLRTVKTHLGPIWGCPTCGGRGIVLGTLWSRVSGPFMKMLWSQIRKTRAQSARSCPSCHYPMAQVETTMQAKPFIFECCQKCRVAWFDKDEIEQLPESDVSPLPEDFVPIPVAKTTPAKMEPRYGGTSSEASWWEMIIGVVGFPVEATKSPLSRTPWITILFGIAMVAGSLASWLGYALPIMEYGMLASDPMRHGGLTFLTGMVLHADIVHLLGNLYFLIIFGDDVEDFLGHIPYLLLLIASSVCGDLLHNHFMAASPLPSIGASGAISGVLAFYALSFPHVRIRLWPAWFLPMIFFTMSAATAFVLWLAIQGFIVMQQLSGHTNISGLAHLGGVACGFVVWFFAYMWSSRSYEY